MKNIDLEYIIVFTKYYLCVLCGYLEGQSELVDVESVVKGYDSTVNPRLDQVVGKVLEEINVSTRLKLCCRLVGCLTLSPISTTHFMILSLDQTMTSRRSSSQFRRLASSASRS